MDRELETKYKEDYFKELGFFTKMIGNQKIDLKELDLVIRKCLDILIKKKSNGIDFAIIKTSNEYFRTACKFIHYFYGYETIQEKEFKDLKFTCCQYKENGYSIRRLLVSIFSNRLKHTETCKCQNKKLYDKRIFTLSEDNGITYYQITIEQISFKINF